MNITLSESLTSTNCSAATDRAFGPTIGGPCRGGFDFTLMFEQSILSIGPSSILLLAGPIRLCYLYRSSSKVIRLIRPSKAKFISTVVLTGLQIALVVLWALDEPLGTLASIPAAVIALVDALVLCHLSYLEHTRSIQPSTLLSLYLFASLVLDIPQSRTLLLRGNLTAIAAVFTCSIALKLVLLFLESFSKRRLLVHPYKDYPPEAISGIFNRTFFWWLNPLLGKGLRGLLGFNDLFDIDPAFSSQRLGNRAQKEWDAQSTLKTSNSLLKTCIRTLWWPFILAIPPRIALIGFNYAQPFLISSLISFVSSSRSNQSYNESLGLIAATAIIYLGLAVFNVSYMHQLYRAITMLRGVLTRLIFNKTLKIRDGVWDEAAAVTLMSTDIDRIATSLQNLNEIWARTAEVAIGIWLLSEKLGWVAVLPMSIIVVCILANTRLSKGINNRQKHWNGAVQKRIAVTSSTLGSIKSVKMTGLSNVMSETIQKLRSEELHLTRGYWWLMTITSTIANTPTIWAPVLTIAAFAAQPSSDFSVNRIFTSLSIITLVTQPAQMLLSAITDTASCLGCFSRIQSFLLSPAREETRHILNTATTSRNKFRQKSLESHSKVDPVSNSSEKELGSSKDFINSACIGIEVQSLTARPAPKCPPAIFKIDFVVGSGKVAIVTGPVGCGKTTLLRAILGEVPPDDGSVTVSSSRIAFCAQEPWIMNIPLHQTITGLDLDLAVSEQWYREVISACALERDFAALPDGDQSIPGSNGLTLSGGQRQRLALARAVYSRAEIVLLDDIFSALDTKTETHVLERLLGTTGLFRSNGTTVVVVTHSQRPVPFADLRLALHKDGTIAGQGPPTHLVSAEEIKDEIISIEPDQGKNPKTSAAAPKKTPAIRGPSANDVDDLTRRVGDFAVYKYYFKSIGVLAFSFFFAVTAIMAFATYFQQIWLQWWTEAKGSDFSKYISVYALLAAIAWSFRGVVFWSMLVYISPRSSARLHLAMLNTMMNAPMSFFSQNDSGVVINRFSQDIGLIDRILPISLGRVSIQVLSIVAQVALISLGSAYMAISIPPLLLSLYILQKTYLLTSRQMRYLDLEGRSPLYTSFLETLSGLATIRNLGWGSVVENINIKRLDQSQQPYYLLYCIQRWLNMVLNLIVAAMAVIVVALATLVPDQSSPAALGVALNNILGFSQSLKNLIDSWTQLETSLGSIARLKTFEATVTPEHQVQENYDPGDRWPENGKIEIKNVTASYNESAVALKNINFNIEAGQRIGICGRSGSGKSSLLLTLLRLLEIDEGTILIDGIDIASVPRNLVRERIATVSQDALVLSETVRRNLDPFQNLTDEDIISALEKVQLWEIIALRGGLDAHMKTQPLSQGQQQLFALARALVRGCRVLILDEATSNVDSESDKLMQRILRQEFDDSDVVAVLDDGEIVEFGNPQELLKKGSTSRFSKLYENGNLEQ